MNYPLPRSCSLVHWHSVVVLIQASLREPQTTMRAILAQNAHGFIVWPMLLVVAALSTIIAVIAGVLIPNPVVVDQANTTARLTLYDLPVLLLRFPLLMFGFEFVIQIVMGSVLYKVGQWFGGRGGFIESLLVVVWLDILFLAFDAVRVLLNALLPITMVFTALAYFVLFFYFISQFCLALHGFHSAWRVFFISLLTMFVLSLILLVFLAFFGFLVVPVNIGTV